MTFDQLRDQADQQLFNKLRNNSNHCLHSLLPPPSTASQHYNLHQAAHNKYMKELHGTSQTQISLHALYIRHVLINT